MDTAKFNYIEDLIKELSSQERYVVLVFLLKSQQVEYALKYFLSWFPYKNGVSYADDFLDRTTLGPVIGKLEEINSEYLNEIVQDSKEFLKIRNEVTHHFLTSDKSIQELESECSEKIKIAENLARKIIYLMDYTDEIIHGFSPGHRL